MLLYPLRGALPSATLDRGAKRRRGYDSFPISVFRFHLSVFRSKSPMRTYIAIDLKSFYASVECIERGLDPLTALLVVADESRTDKTI